jgi:hypothetical protein
MIIFQLLYKKIPKFKVSTLDLNKPLREIPSTHPENNIRPSNHPSARITEAKARLIGAKKINRILT